ncbi:MAG TPA: polyprenol monophosphomannose synthase [Vicinamibacterales bacterium]|nr:polyprenol monophosphomannose synthase [Vicinamibacterales bacterium]
MRSGAPTLVIVPTFNERHNLPTLVEGLMRLDGVSVLVVDDGSPDGTGGVADDLARSYPRRIEVMHRAGRRGLGRSYIDGIRWALSQTAGTYGAVCQMDADLSHDPARVPALAAALADADVALGSRYVDGGMIVNWPLRRRLLSRFANLYIRAVTRLRVHDCTTGFRCWRREALASLPLDRFNSDGYAFLVEMLHAATALQQTIAEVPIVFVERRQDESKLTLAVLFESAIAPWRLIGRRRQ